MVNVSLSRNQVSPIQYVGTVGPGSQTIYQKGTADTDDWTFNLSDIYIRNPRGTPSKVALFGTETDISTVTFEIGTGGNGSKSFNFGIPLQIRTEGSTGEVRSILASTTDDGRDLDLMAIGYLDSV